MKLSIIISNRNDLVMLNLTLNSAIESIKGLNGSCEIIVVDNSDEKIYKLMGTVCPSGMKKHYNVKMFRQEEICFTSARMLAAEKAQGEYIFCVDSHVLFGHNTLKNSLDFMERHKDEKMLGFGHPPIRWAHQGPKIMRHEMNLSPEGLPTGGWGRQIHEESKMFWKFMPWICRRDWYLNTLKGYGTHSDEMLSWGGAELLQQLKSLMLGYNNWAIISDPIIHIGPYTQDIVKTGHYKYRVYAANGNKPHGFGVLVAYAVLGGPDIGYKHAKLAEEKFTKIHHIKVDDYWDDALKMALPEYNWIQKHKKYDYLELLKKRPWND